MRMILLLVLASACASARPAEPEPRRLQYRLVPYPEAVEMLLEQQCPRVMECSPEEGIQRVSWCVEDSLADHCRKNNCRQLSWLPLGSPEWSRCLYELRTRPCKEIEAGIPWICSELWRRSGRRR